MPKKKHLIPDQAHDLRRILRLCCQCGARLVAEDSCLCADCEKVYIISRKEANREEEDGD